LGRKARGAAAAAIEALLASSSTVESITPDQLAAVVAEQGLSLDRLRGPCRDLYRRYFEYCLVDRALSDEELAELAHLRMLLAIDGPTASAVHAEVGYAVYGTAIDEALQDSRMDGDERGFLQKLSQTLGLDAAAAARALEEGKVRARQRYLTDHLSPGALFATPEDQNLEVEGSAEASLQAAVEDALTKAEVVLPGLTNAEVTSVLVDVDAGRIARWSVKLRGTSGDQVE